MTSVIKLSEIAEQRRQSNSLLGEAGETVRRNSSAVCTPSPTNEAIFAKERQRVAERATNDPKVDDALARKVEIVDLPPSIKARLNGTKASRFKVLSMADMSNLPKPGYLVEGLIPDIGIGNIYGAPQAFKSFFARDLCLHVATDKPIYGKFAINLPGPTVMCIGEAPNSFARKRVPAWCKEHGIKRPDDIPFYLVPTVPLVGSPGEVDDLIWAIDLKVPEDCPRLIVIDTKARAMSGLNENDASDMGYTVAAAEKISKHFGCAVAYVDHTGKDTTKGSRGSSALHAGIDFEYEVTRAEGTLVCEIKNTKTKDGDLTPAFYIEGHKVPVTLTTPGEPDEPSDSLAFKIVESPTKSVGKGSALTRSEKAAYDILRSSPGSAMTEDDWRNACTAGRVVSASEDLKSRQTAFRRAAANLQDKAFVGFEKGQYFDAIGGDHVPF